MSEHTMSKEKQRQLNEIYRPMCEEFFNNLEKQYQEIAKIQEGEKQISEIAKIITEYADCGDCENCNFSAVCGEKRLATNLYEAGYRKQSENTVEVIRCKDCEHWYSPNNDDAHYCHLTYGLGGLVAEEDYCSFAKMKGESDD